MPLTGIHILLTYKCDRQCDHCFVFGAPNARGTFTSAMEKALTLLASNCPERE